MVPSPRWKMLNGGSMSLQALKDPALNVSAATAELGKGILALYPQAQIVPRISPLEDEEISVEVRLPLSMEEIYQAPDLFHVRHRRGSGAGCLLSEDARWPAIKRKSVRCAASGVDAIHNIRSELIPLRYLSCRTKRRQQPGALRHAR